MLLAFIVHYGYDIVRVWYIDMYRWRLAHTSVARSICAATSYMPLSSIRWEIAMQCTYIYVYIRIFVLFDQFCNDWYIICITGGSGAVSSGFWRLIYGVAYGMYVCIDVHVFDSVVIIVNSISNQHRLYCHDNNAIIIINTSSFSWLYWFSLMRYCYYLTTSTMPRCVCMRGCMCPYLFVYGWFVCICIYKYACIYVYGSVCGCMLVLCYNSCILNASLQAASKRTPKRTDNHA